jgi:hypothetical protein
MNVSKFERFFRVAGGLDVDKTDLKRCSDFVHRKVYDLLLMSQAAAKFNLRDVIEFWDLPITKGLQESIHGFTKLDEQIELEPILEGPHAAAAARSRVRRRDPFEATVGVWWTERRARAGLQNRRSGSQKSPDAALGDHLQVVRSAAVKATSQSPKAID